MICLFPSRRRIILLIILLPLLVSLACNTLTQTVPAQSTPGKVTMEQDVVYGSGAFTFPDPKAGLADLSSYKATLTISFDGTRDGNAQKWATTQVMIATNNPVTRQWTIEKSGNLADLETVFLAELNGLDYERRGEEGCHTTLIENGNSLRDQLELAGFLNFVVGADEAGSETVNDVVANHYMFDQRALGQQGLTESAGEIWVASEGGYIVKYVLTSKANADYFGEGIEGTLSLDYELTDVNQIVVPTLPADCPAGLVDAPLMEDAQEIQVYPGLTLYNTSSEITAVVDFYQTKLPQSGWQLEGDADISDTNAFIKFSRNNDHLGITISVGEKGTEVRLFLVNPVELNMQTP